MNAPTRLQIVPPPRSGPSSFLERVCAPFLLDAQNEDGGWGFSPGEPSRVEPTSWAVLALRSLPAAPHFERRDLRGCFWLGEVQRDDGSWGAAAGAEQECWVTSLACLAMREQGTAPALVERAARWLLKSWPGEGGWWWRMRETFFSRREVVRQNHGLRGWSWTANTSSWVEPTAYALLALRNLSAETLERKAAKRWRLGQAMLRDRMCPEGGWNCGNPMVYGMAGQPLVLPTVWAILSLQNLPDAIEVQQGLDWLEKAYPKISGPGSLALAHLCLETQCRTVPALEPDLDRLYRANAFCRQVPVMAWAAMALGPWQDWFRWPTKRRG